MSTSLENNFVEPVVAMLVYGLVTALISYLTCKSIKLRRLVLGKSIVLLDNGKLYKKNFTKSKLDINEFLVQCRVNGYFNINDIQTAILEPNGKISFLPISIKRPSTPEDLKLSPMQEALITNIIIDGNVLDENLKNSGHDMNWLKSELKKQGIAHINDIFLATCDNKNNLSVYVKLSEKFSHDKFI